MTSMNSERRIYRTLRDECHFTHEMIREITKIIPSPRWVDVLKAEKRILKDSCEAIVEQLGVMCIRDTVEDTIAAIETNTKDLSYAITSMVVSWVATCQNYSPDEKTKLWNAQRSKKRQEQKYAREEWQTRLLKTYLIVKGLLPPDLI